MNSKKNQFLKSGIGPVRNCVHSRRKFDISNGVCAIVDRNTLPKRLIKRKLITYIQIRKKNATAISLIKKIKTIKKKISVYNIPIFVNDRIDVAVAANTDGLHIGRGDMDISLARRILPNECVIGKTVRNQKEAQIAQSDGADYISIGPIFKTPLKKEIKPKGLAILKEVKGAVNIPVVAIGGINFSNMDKVKKAGADGIAMIRGLN